MVASTPGIQQDSEKDIPGISRFQNSDCSLISESLSLSQIPADPRDLKMPKPQQ